MSTLAVAGLSARMMAEAAADDGFDVVALDLFGDVDTCAAASRWFGIGEPDRLRIDDQRLLAALAVLARQGGAMGWVAGGGFEGRPGLLARGSAVLPLIGTAPDAVARLRDPAAFFAFLAEHDIDHPPVRWTAPADGRRWLLKDLHGCGGWHIRYARPGEAVALASTAYLQLEMSGEPMSATFVGAADGARLLGVNRQIVRALGGRPHVFHGVVGPVPVSQRVQAQLQRILAALTSGFALRGLASLDFLLDGDRVLVLELNPRPPASLALYVHGQPMASHVHACREGVLPTLPAAPPETAVRGHEIVFARRPFRLGAAAARRLADRPDAHDLPGAGQQFAAGQPVCSIEACADSADAVVAQLDARREDVLRALETVS